MTRQVGAGVRVGRGDEPEESDASPRRSVASTTRLRRRSKDRRRPHVRSRPTGARRSGARRAKRRPGHGSRGVSQGSPSPRCGSRSSLLPRGHYQAAHRGYEEDPPGQGVLAGAVGLRLEERGRSGISAVSEHLPGQVDWSGSCSASERACRVGGYAPPHLGMQCGPGACGHTPGGDRCSTTTSRSSLAAPQRHSEIRFKGHGCGHHGRGLTSPTDRDVDSRNTAAGDDGHEAGESREVAAPSGEGPHTRRDTQAAGDEPTEAMVALLQGDVRADIGAPPGLERDSLQPGRTTTVSVSGSIRSRSHPEPESEVSASTSRAGSEADDSPPQEKRARTLNEDVQRHR